jgi:hypothetical protein
MDRSLRVPHPSATARGCPRTVRLACVRHAASVRSEPGSNSQVHHTAHLTMHRTTNRTRTRRSIPRIPRRKNLQNTVLRVRYVKTASQRPTDKVQISQPGTKPADHQPGNKPTLTRKPPHKGRRQRTPSIKMNLSKNENAARNRSASGRRYLGAANGHVNGVTLPFRRNDKQGREAATQAASQRIET